MRKLVLALLLSVGASAAMAQEQTPAQRVAGIHVDGCTVTSSSRTRVEVSCRTKEAADAFVQQATSLVGQALMPYGPSCSYTLAEPHTVTECGVMFGPRA